MVKLDNDIDKSNRCISEILLENNTLCTSSIELLCDYDFSDTQLSGPQNESKFRKGFLIGEQLQDDSLVKSCDNDSYGISNGDSNFLTKGAMNDGRKKIFDEIDISSESPIDIAADREILNLEGCFNSY